MPVLSSVFTLFLLSTLLSNIVISQQQPVLNSDEQESVYQVLESINSDISWRSLFPDDLCNSAPHGVVCSYYSDSAINGTGDERAHISELSFGYVSDYSPNPPCTPNSSLSPRLASFKHLRKLFFYKCFINREVSVLDFSSSFGSSLEELVFVENPAIVGSLSGLLGNFSSLRRLVLSGSKVSGEIPDTVGNLPWLEQITLTGNRLSGEIPLHLTKLKKLRLLDLSHNGFRGNVTESIGELTELMKLDLSSNQLTGRIPKSIKNLKNLEFLDLSYNRFANYGVPLFLAEMPSLKEVYLSGNKLGGRIPEIWENLGGVLGIGLSKMGLVGNIPSSMGVFLGNLCYLGLDNNELEGTLPEELGFLERVNELNLENNRLSGRIPFSVNFSARIGGKLKVGGNSELCVEEGLRRNAKNGSSWYNLKVCQKPDIPNPVLISSMGSLLSQPSGLLIILALLFGFHI